jgi:hypothetical protein
MKRVLVAALFLGSLSLAGCASSGRAYYVSAPPPPLRYEVRGVPPGAGYAWRDGYWVLRGGSYGWVPGHWMVPPRGRSVWVPGYWSQRGGRYYYRGGRWR